MLAPSFDRSPCAFVIRFLCRSMAVVDSSGARVGASGGVDKRGAALKDSAFQ